MSQKTKEQYEDPESDKPGRSPWVPGLVEVKFRSAKDSGLIDFDFSKPLERTSYQKQWSAKLSQILTRNKLRTWRPSFPLRYSWSRETEEEARKFYSASGRDKLITFRFSDDADVSHIAKELQALSEVTRANPVAKVAPPAPIQEPKLGTSDQDLQKQWYAFRCKLTEALETVTGDGVVVAVLDWGFDTAHNDYGPNIELKWNIFNRDTGISEGLILDHGTASIGLAGARLNYFGIVGFAPDSILWAIQAGRDEVVNHFDWVEGIDFVRSEPSPQRKVIILEIQTVTGGNIESIQAINQAITDAIAANIVVCVPAGNSPGDANLDDSNKEIPETCSVLVGATDFHARDNFLNSKEGRRIVVYAPGDFENDLTCRPGNDHTLVFGGTSGAVAKVGGAVALMLEANPSLTPAQVRCILGRSKIPVLRDIDDPVGVLLDCKQAVSDSLTPVSEDECLCPRDDY